jgi:hypothetical protein
MVRTEKATQVHFPNNVRIKYSAAVVGSVYHTGERAGFEETYPMTRTLAFAAAAVVASQALAVIRHPDPLETSNGDPVGPSQWYAKFGSNASGIAIGPHHVLTTRHQGGGVGTTLTFTDGLNAGTYTIASETTFGSGVDLRVVTINATLPTYASLYTGSLVGQTALIGGFGPQRVAPNYVNNSNELIGYGVENTPGNAHPILFGQNRIDSLASASGAWSNTPLLVADFDGPENVTPPYAGISPTATNKVDYEAALAEGDSGGGWFIDVGGSWKLAGLSHGAALVRINELGAVGSYSNPANGSPAFLFSGQIAAVNLTPYYSNIVAVIPEPAMLGALAMGVAALGRRRR